MIIGALGRWQRGILVYQSAITEVAAKNSGPVDEEKVLSAVFFVACIIKRAIIEIEDVDTDFAKESLPASIKVFATQVVACQSMVGNRPAETKGIPAHTAFQLLTEFRSAGLYQTDEDGCAGIVITAAVFPHPIFLIRWSEILRICDAFIDLKIEASPRSRERIAADKPKAEATPKSTGTHNILSLPEIDGRDDNDDDDDSEGGDGDWDENLVHRRRYIPNWIGPRFIDYLAGRPYGSTEPPVELRRILDDLSLSSIERLADATLDDLDPAELEGIDMRLVHDNAIQHAILFSTIYLLSLSISKYPSIADVVVRNYYRGVRVSTIPVYDWSDGTNAELEYLVTILVKIFDAGIWNTNRNARNFSVAFDGFAFMMFGGVEVLERCQDDDAFQLELFAGVSDQIAKEFLPNCTPPFEQISAFSPEISAWRKRLVEASHVTRSPVNMSSNVGAGGPHMVSAETKEQTPTTARIFGKLRLKKPGTDETTH